MNDREIAGRFNVYVGRVHGAVLVGGAPEPLYLPACPEDGRARAIIRYTLDYAQSALHEIAHWCVAGDARRKLPDYGYWYVPPPRSVAEQAAFFAAETRAQALESVFADACGVKFRVSVDQTGKVGADVGKFAALVAEQAERIRREAPRGRADAVLEALSDGGRRVASG